jgi:spermidine synthase
MRKSDLLFFLTGAAALVYQTVWIRLLARLFGSDAGGMALVLAVFMGGMAAGSFALSGVARRTRRPVAWFAGLEAGLGLWAALSPLALAWIDPLAGAAPRLALALGFLVPPTMAMGATFPLMARLVIRREEETGSETGAFYGANTLGAAAGALLGPLALMPALGLSWTLAAAALLDLAAAALALRWLEAGPAGDERPAARPPTGPSPILVGTFLVGAAGLGLEVVLSRVLVTLTGASVYAYAIVLAVFLTGIGLGSRQLVRRSARGGAWTASATTFRRCALALPALTLAGLLALQWQLGGQPVLGALENRMPAGTGVLRLWASHALFAGLALLAPAVALGAALPSAAAAHAAARPPAERERALARVYAFNTAGALLGTLAAGFLLLPLGLETALLALLALGPVAALLVGPRRPAELAGGLGAALLLALLLHPGPDSERGSRRVLLEAHDAHAGVAVEEIDEEGGGAVRALRVNGKVVATTAPVDLRLQRLLGHVPALLHGEVERALVIGLGTGMTAGSLLDHPSLTRLDVFEISGAVPEGARRFAAWNGDVVDAPRTAVRRADGRHALATSEERWDLVTSDPIHPWTRGSSDLYALEHFEEMAAHLAPGGIASQWLPLYQLSTEDVRTVIATWCAAFPHVSAWLTAYDLALVGSNEPLAGPGELAARPFPPAVAAHLAEAGVHSPAELAALAVADDAALREFAGGVAAMTDDRPVLEFRAPLSFLAGYANEVLTWAGREAYVERLPAASRDRAREVRAALATFLAEQPAGLGRAARRYGEALLSLPPLR